MRYFELTLFLPTSELLSLPLLYIYGEKENVIQQSVHHTMFLIFSLMNRGVAVSVCPDLFFFVHFLCEQFELCFFVCTCIFALFVSFCFICFVMLISCCFGDEIFVSMLW